ncbi:hypothetical protein LF41_1065 [Lysobacter dokdonensis DS-58]|uniref:7-cyano-7-deazaguanine synthase n=1 Tax=Lysobacter dokdonensis DS-58 TaxID=1300345 RepID=A0A0A2WL54_9GAMM|nr:hypothetical protein [Lysobacter dokdonensis]KGQ20528.1 hypothetical protein LF41_1065 [Lysobacter dokdonensis DS-58]
MHGGPVEIFWTGGWDSTFLLLRLLLVDGLTVQPLYLLDRTRASTQTEIDTMDRIRDALAHAHPGTRTSLLPTIMAEVADIAPDAQIQAAGDRMSAQHGVGNQYPWMARYCKQHGKDDVEIGAERARHVHGAGLVLFDNLSEPFPCSRGYMTRRIFSDAPSHDAWLIYGAYSFSLIDTTRQQMVDEAKRNGWGAFMGLTWFCHSPAGERRPCGLCNPCINAIQEGFGWRIPRSRRLLSAVYQKTLWPLRKTARKLVLRRRLAAAET